MPSAKKDKVLGTNHNLFYTSSLILGFPGASLVHEPILCPLVEVSSPGFSPRSVLALLSKFTLLPTKINQIPEAGHLL
jgi:hypothetical protein